MKRCAFLSLARTEGWIMDDDRAVGPLRKRGWEVVTLPWDGNAAWGDLDAVVVRSTWDYHHDLDRFLRVVEEIAGTGIPVVNDPAWIRWNARKSYLAELAGAGAPVVPTVFLDRRDPSALDEAARHLGTRDLVLKPEVGASAQGLRRVRLPGGAGTRRGSAAGPQAGGDDSGAWLCQPFVPAVVTEGEYSLIFLDGAFSHAVLKRPRPGDIRVQEEHGGEIRAVAPSPDLLESAREVLGMARQRMARRTPAGGPGAAPPFPLQARVDLVRGDAGWWLMELELIEPALYLRTDPGAPERFADALVHHLRR